MTGGLKVVLTPYQQKISNKHRQREVLPTKALLPKSHSCACGLKMSSLASKLKCSLISDVCAQSKPQPQGKNSVIPLQNMSES